MLDKLAEKRLSIRNLVLEEPVRIADTGFHPEKDLDEAWPVIITLMEASQEANRDTELFRIDILRTAAIVNLLYPEKAESLDLKKYLPYMLASLKFHAQNDQAQFLTDSMYLRMLFPAEARQMEDNPTVKDGIARLKESRSFINNDLSNPHDDSPRGIHSIFVGALRAKIAFPQFQDMPNLARHVDQEIKFAREQEKAFVQSGDYSEFDKFLTSLVALKVLFPAQFTQNRLLNDENWKIMQSTLAEVKKISLLMDYFLEIAFYMKLLSVEEIRISREHGLELIMPKQKPDFSKALPPLPEVRKF